MRKSRMPLLLGLVLAFAPICVAMAQGPSAARQGVSSSPAAAEPDFAVLKGTWVRPDGGYVIAITSVSPGGKIEATYFNPNRLPFAKAQATRDGATLRAFFELRAGGYGGSTYELAYDPANDRLVGVYNQAVAKQKFVVYFTRK